jgi:tetratricopeptide (TPR) repeat protein
VLLRFASVRLAASALLALSSFAFCAFAQNSGRIPQPLATPNSTQLEDSVARYQRILSSGGVTDTRTLNQIRVQLATAHFLLHRYTDSLHDLKPLESAAGKQMSEQAWTIKGLDELELNQLTDAVHSLRLAIHTNAKSATARLALGDALARSGRMEDAARENERQTQMTPSLADAWYKLGLAHSQISADLSHDRVKASEQNIVQQLAGEEMLAKDDNLNAARTLFRLARTFPSQPQVHAELGSALLALGYATAARDHFRQELLNNPESPLAKLGLAQTDALSGNWEQVAAELDQLSTTNPAELTRMLEFPSAGLLQQAWTAGKMKPPTSFTQSRAGAIWSSWFSDSDAMPKFSEKEGRSPVDFCSGQLKNPQPGVWLSERCYSTLAKQLQARTTLSISDRIKLAESDFRLGEYESALYAAKQLRVADPQSGWAVYWMSKAHDALAEACFVKVGILNPDSARVHQMLGEHYLKLSDYPKAKIEFQNAVRLSPESPDLHLGLGTALSRAGDLDAAEGELKTALQLAPKSDFAHYELGHLYVRQNRWQPAIEHLRQVSPDATVLLSARLDLAKAESEIGNKSDAVRDLLSVASLDHDGEVYFRLATLYRSLGQEQQAHDALATFKERRAASLQTDTEELGALEKEQEIGRAATPQSR